MDKNEVLNNLYQCLNQIKPVEIECSEDYIFSAKYMFTPEEVVYALFKMSEEYRFQIDETFVDELADGRFCAIAELVCRYAAISQES